MWTAIATVFVSVLGSSAVAAVVTGWMTRETNTSVEQLKASYEHSHIVTKAQLEIELAAYQKVWKAVADFEQGMQNFISIPLLASLTKASEEGLSAMKEKWFADAFEELTRLNNEVVPAALNQRPFMDAEIAQHAFEFATLCSRITGQCLTEIGGTAMSAEWMETRNTWQAEVVQRATTIADLMRARLDKLRVLA